MGVSGVFPESPTCSSWGTCSGTSLYLYKLSDPTSCFFLFPTCSIKAQCDPDLDEIRASKLSTSTMPWRLDQAYIRNLYSSTRVLALVRALTETCFAHGDSSISESHTQPLPTLHHTCILFLPMQTETSCIKNMSSSFDSSSTCSAKSSIPGI